MSRGKGYGLAGFVIKHASKSPIFCKIPVHKELHIVAFVGSGGKFPAHVQFIEPVPRPGEGIAHPASHISEKFMRSEEHTSELQSRGHLVCRLLLENKNADSQTADDNP